MLTRISKVGFLAATLMFGALALSGCDRAAASRSVVAADEWPSFGRDGSEQHYSPLDEVNQENVGKLNLAWHFDLESGHTVSAPVMAEGKLFVTTGHSYIRAFEATTGKLLWEYDAKVREISKNNMHLTWGAKGLSYWNGRVFIATADGRVIALDAKTGKPIWEQRQFSADEPRSTNGPPRVFDGKVIVGHGGADLSAIRGYVTAYDGMTGKQLWRFYTVPGDPSKPAESKAEEVMRPTWKGDWFGKGAGGTAWNAFSYDPELDLLYIGVGNGYPYNQKLRSPGGGDNLFLASVVAVKADTGEYVWHYQVCPAEQWDCTAVQDMTLADLKIDGKLRKVLIQAPKNGFLYVLDRKTGEFISAEKFSKVTWAERIDPKTGRPVENPALRKLETTFELWPGPQGSHSWLPQAFSPRTGLVYIPVMEMGAFIGPPVPGQGGISGSTGVSLVADPDLPGSRRSYLKAWDPLTQKQAWNVELPGAWPGGVLATAGDLVFQGQIDGNFVARDARSGKVLWSFKTGAPIVAPPISYAVNGVQYVTVLTGSGSQGGGILATGNAAYRTDYRLPRRVLTFAIGGKDALPNVEPPELAPISDPGFTPEPARVMEGAMAFGNNACLVCHGMNAIGGGAAPDLRYSAVILDQAAFRAIVKEGALLPNGMPRFASLTDQQLEAIRYYLRARAMEAPGELQRAQAGKGAASPAPQTQPLSRGM